MSVQTSIIIPAHNEERYITDCLESLLDQEGIVGRLQIIVIANGCDDRTAMKARAFDQTFSKKGFDLTVIETAEASKPQAINAGEAIAYGSIRIFLDADVRLGSEMCSQLIRALEVTEPRLATGTVQIGPGRSLATRLFRRAWLQTPFVQAGGLCCGLYAVNAAARGRWGGFPEIIADDMFVRSQFSDEERIEVTALYDWKLAEGWVRLIRVRSRQEKGMRELLAFNRNHSKQRQRTNNPWALVKLVLHDPVAGLTYAAITALGKFLAMGNDRKWHRGRP